MNELRNSREEKGYVIGSYVIYDRGYVIQGLRNIRCGYVIEIKSYVIDGLRNILVRLRNARVT